ncbi:MAG TPA: Ig-like domain-containing protein [Cyclobacteriaceae bacterium]
MKKNIHYFLSILLVSGCVGTDILNDELVESRVLIAPKDTTVLINSQFPLEATFWNQFGVKEEDVQFSFSSSDETIAIVSNQGVVNTLSNGMARITAMANGVISDQATINVIESVDELASISINSTSSRIDINGTVQLTAIAFNLSNIPIDDVIFNWRSQNPDIAIVDNNGLVTGISEGMTNIVVMSEEISSQPFEIVVGSPERFATFEGASGYVAEGSVELVQDGDVIILNLSEDFMTSIALGTFIYLSNTTSGSGTRSNGLELGMITRDQTFENGTRSVNVSEIAEMFSTAVGFNQFRYVIVLCKPASITFGFADFES